MPMYEYRCDECGVFAALGKMSESSSPTICPDCGELSERILSAPRLAIIGKAQRSAHERNEKSANEPRSTRRSSCGCAGAHTCSSSSAKPSSAQGANAKEKGSLLQMQTKKTARPWMLGH
ncbi:zinc ribbon domain-containing protein [Methylobacillus gramineus]|uniref:FmdB family zinc ribbon protein n=1 Tax=Methylobacillus gramineus TaxID=755169 RepID=UPI001CFFF28B|nr:zinc ribbon domain-containing protein [Methylobacillus gramineus]MCB5184626.1 zinc ribbon domain-containing protein [Methylobacillus gramineus]